tara:strand:+ start:1121 stop:1354 length:234 start_codon:yes stop_codon:yes gene_type:complete
MFSTWSTPLPQNEQLTEFLGFLTIYPLPGGLSYQLFDVSPYDLSPDAVAVAASSEAAASPSASLAAPDLSGGVGPSV